MFFWNIRNAVRFIRSRYVVWCTRAAPGGGQVKRGGKITNVERERRKRICNPGANRIIFLSAIFVLFLYFSCYYIRNKNIRISVGGGGRGDGGGKYLGV